MKDFSVKKWFSKIVLESDKEISFCNIDFITNVNIKPRKGVVDIEFITKDKKFNLKTSDLGFYKWIKENPENNGNQVLEFTVWFLKNNEPIENTIMSEIVDEYNGLIGDKDIPKDNSRMIGLTSKDSTQAVYQTRAKSKNNFNTGAVSGFISW